MLTEDALYRVKNISGNENIQENEKIKYSPLFQKGKHKSQGPFFLCFKTISYAGTRVSNIVRRAVGLGYCEHSSTGSNRHERKIRFNAESKMHRLVHLPNVSLHVKIRRCAFAHCFGTKAYALSGVDCVVIALRRGVCASPSACAVALAFFLPHIVLVVRLEGKIRLS